MLTKTVVALLTAYVLVVAVLYAGQRRLQYAPDTTLITPEEVGLTGFSLEMIETPDGERLVTWFAPPRDGKATIVYLQGNAAGLADRRNSFEEMHAAGYGFLGLGYRGFSGSTGSPSEAGFLIDARSAIDHLAGKGIGLNQIVFFGESMGTGIAMQLAADPDTSPGAIILEAPYTAIADIAAKRYWFAPVRLLMKDQFRTMDVAHKVQAPVFIFHGEDDLLISPDHARKVHAAITSEKELQIIPNRGHVEELTPELFDDITAFIDRHVPKTKALPEPSDSAERVRS